MNRIISDPKPVISSLSGSKYVSQIEGTQRKWYIARFTESRSLALHILFQVNTDSYQWFSIKSTNRWSDMQLNSIQEATKVMLDDGFEVYECDDYSEVLRELSKNGK